MSARSSAGLGAPEATRLHRSDCRLQIDAWPSSWRLLPGSVPLAARGASPGDGGHASDPRGHPRTGSIRSLLTLSSPVPGTSTAACVWRACTSRPTRLVAFTWSVPPMRLWAPCGYHPRGYNHPDRVGGPTMLTNSTG
jgi:hypothetical protein